MKKIKITKTISMISYDENDYLNNQKEIYDSMIKIINSFDADQTAVLHKEYIDNLNGDIYLENKKVNIFLLKQNQIPISFAIFSNDKLDMIWTNFEYVKLGFATIILRVVATELKLLNISSFDAEVNSENLVAQSLFDSFAKVEGVEHMANNQENNKKTHKFDIKNIKNDKILQEIKDFAI